MDYKSWKLWVRSLPWKYRWFVYLILLRPIIDNFYYLKEISPLLSPLYWAGVLTPLLCLPVIFREGYHKNITNTVFNFWAFLVVLNSLLFIFLPFDFLTIFQWVLRLTMPVYLYLFIRAMVRNRANFLGLLTTFLYACAIASLMLLYELIFSPIRVEYSRGLERIQGGYADVMNYAIYLSFGFLILSYFYLSSKANRINFKVPIWFLAGAFVLIVAGLISISHTSSYVVILVLIALFSLYSIRRFGLAAIFVLMVMLLVSSFYWDTFYSERLSPIVEREMEVIEGEREQTQLFHGRMNRWSYGLEALETASPFALLFGYPFTLNNPLFQVGIGIHNDYLRVFFLTGAVGFLLYLLFLFSLWRRKRYLFSPERYIISGAIVILAIYSISTTPTFYANFLYVLFTIFAYVSLPPKVHRG